MQILHSRIATWLSPDRQTETAFCSKGFKVLDSRLNLTILYLYFCDCMTCPSLVAASSVQPRPSSHATSGRGVTRIRGRGDLRISSFVFDLMSPSLILECGFEIKYSRWKSRQIVFCSNRDSDQFDMDQKKGLGLSSRACMKCVHLGVSQNFRTQFVRTWSHNISPLLAIVLSPGLKHIFAKLWLLYLSSSPADSTRLIHHSSFRLRQKVQCDQWEEPSFQCLHKVTTKYFQPLAITRTRSTWNILTSKHLLQSPQD